MRRITLSLKIYLLIFIFGFLFTHLHYSTVSAADPKTKAKQGIVKIIAQKPGELQETGAGIILSAKNQKIYILTAFHVIEDANKIYIKFFDYPDESFIGQPFQRIDMENDLAIVRIEISKMPEKISLLPLGDIKNVSETDKVIALGHPANDEWEYSSAELRSSEEPFQFRFTGEAVNPGNSGGALLNEKFQLIGLVVKKLGQRDGIALKMDFALEKIKNWGIPSNLKKPRKKWPWIVGAGGVLAGTTIGYIIGRSGNKGEGELPDAPGRPN